MTTTVRTGDKSSAIFARRGQTDKNITKPSEFIQRRYAITNFGHDEDSDARESRSMRSRRASVFGEIGSLWGSGAIDMEIPAGDAGFLDIIHGVFGEPTPVSSQIPHKTLVPSSAKISDVTKAKYFTDTKNQTVNVVNAQNITTDGDLTIADNLSGYLPETELTLTVTPSKKPDSGTATVTITYTEVSDGATHEVTLSFTAVTAQTVKLPADATITNVAVASWQSQSKTLTISTSLARQVVRNPHPNHPGKLRFTLSAAIDGGKITIRGLRKIGLLSDDTLPLQEVIALDSGKVFNTLKSFHKIGDVKIVDSSGTAVTSGTVTIESRTSHYKTVLKMSDDLPNGWDIEGEVGGEPRTIRKAIAIGATIDISDTIGISLDMLSRRVDKRRTLNGDPFAEQFVATAETRKSDFPFITERFFTDIGAYLELDGDAVLFDSAPITITHNYDFSSGKSGSPFRSALEPTDRRNVSVAIATSYRAGSSEEDVFIKWDEKFRNKEAVSAKLVMYKWLTDGEQVSIAWDLGYCEITAPIRVEASGPGRIPINVPLKAVPDPTTNESSEITCTIIEKDQWK